MQQLIHTRYAICVSNDANHGFRDQVTHECNKKEMSTRHVDVKMYMLQDLNKEKIIQMKLIKWRRQLS